MLSRGWPLAALTVLLLALTSVPQAATAAVTDTQPSQLVLTVPASGKVSGPATLTATLTSGDLAVADAPVHLEQLTNGVWGEISAGITDADGGASYDVTLAGTTNTFRARFDGDDVHDPALSDTGAVAATKYTSKVLLGGATKVVDGHSAILTVDWHTFSGRPVSGPVQVERRLGHGAWRAFTSVTTNAKGTTAFRVSPRFDSRWRARVAEGTWYLADISPVHALDNRPPDRPVGYPKHASHPSYLKPQQRAQGKGANVTISRIPSSVWNKMTGITWHRGCPVGRSGLRYLRINYRGFDGYRYRGSLIVNVHAAQSFKSVFKDLYTARIPIRRMFPVDRFGYSRRSGGGDDYKAMRYDNTSAFNCRWVTGRPGVLSPHSYGYALDLNTWENPYHSAQGWLPNGWWPHRGYGRIAWRSGHHKVVRILRSHGFSWTYGTEDSQHFDAPGGRGRRIAESCSEFCD